MKSLLLALLLLPNLVFGQEVYSKGELTGIPVPVPLSVKTPSDELEKLSWTHYALPDFTILSIDKDQGLFLSQNIEQIKAWILKRWNLENFDFSKPAVVVCVPNKDMMKKLFQLERSYSEVRIENGKIGLAILWVVLDAEPAQVIPNALTPICLREFQQSHQYKMPFWLVRGMSILNMTIAQIRQNIASLKNDPSKQIYYPVADFLDMTEQKFATLDPAKQQQFDRQCAVLALLFRKEYGPLNFMSYLQSGNLNELGLKDANELQPIFNRYYSNLISDIVGNLTPDEYLQVKPIVEGF